MVILTISNGHISMDKNFIECRFRCKFVFIDIDIDTCLILDPTKKFLADIKNDRYKNNVTHTETIYYSSYERFMQK